MVEVETQTRWSTCSGDGARGNLENALEDLGLNLGDAYYDGKEDLDVQDYSSEKAAEEDPVCHVELANFPVILWQHFIKT
jgi:hypothetical protein